MKEYFLNQPIADKKISPRRLLGRSFKLGMALLQITMLRAPTEGYVTAGKLTARKFVKRSTIVETILNAWRNDRALADLEGELRRFLKQHQAALS